MEIGIIHQFQLSDGVGQVLTADGRHYAIDYADGQTMMLTPEEPVPIFSGRHKQPAGFRLKVPRVGDSVIFRAADDTPRVLVWGYTQHFVDLLERKHGPSFGEYRRPLADRVS